MIKFPVVYDVEDYILIRDVFALSVKTQSDEIRGKVDCEIDCDKRYEISKSWFLALLLRHLSKDELKSFMSILSKAEASIYEDYMCRELKPTYTQAVDFFELLLNFYSILNPLGAKFFDPENITKQNLLKVKNCCVNFLRRNKSIFKKLMIKWVLFLWFEKEDVIKTLSGYINTLCRWILCGLGVIYILYFIKIYFFM